ncbi:hypothetical protein [uncultured Sphingomonas sp.]|uniref:hypothetical protein n=1 Tax=uncultured Sphingomonas sp. TaxID=158754 RepID=UPI0025CFE4B5|nr:hypothetical protein [uncultured Sphingomonas sp.]
MYRADPAVPARAGDEPSIDEPAPEAVRGQLERLRTHAFAGSGKLFSFLRFVVEEALAGRGATLKELVIGIELYGGVVDYDPRIDSTVRVEARRLRRKLDAYYGGQGARDPVIISMPTGSYAPCFRLRVDAEPVPPTPSEPAVCAPMLAVLPFTALCSEERAFAAGLTDELIHAAEGSARFRAAPRAIMFQFRETRYSLDAVAAETGADLVLHGTVRSAQDVRRIAVELSNRWGQILWSDRIDVAGDGDLGAQERIAAHLLTRLPAVLAEAG